MRTLLASLLLFASTGALADRIVYNPDGSHCRVDDQGRTVGCAGPTVVIDPGETAAREARRAEEERAAKLAQCLRTADWPSMPGRDECARLYGGPSAPSS